MIGCDKGNLYADFSKTNLKENRAYMLNAYGSEPRANLALHPTIKDNPPRVQYYNDDKQEKKKKTKLISIIILSATAVIGSIAAVFAHKKGSFSVKELTEILSDVQQKSDEIKDMHLDKKMSNLMSNFINIKDDFWNRITQKVKDLPVLNKLSKFDEKTTNFYKAAVKNSLKGNYEKAAKKLMETKGSENIKIQKFDDWFNEIDKVTFDKIRNGKSRISDVVFEENVLEKLTKANIADTRLARENTIINAYTSKIDIPEDASSALKYAIEDFNKVKFETADTLIPKLRDINAGQAPTDFISILTSIGALGIATIAADDKEERESTVINLGIPLIATLTTTTIATLKAMSGAKGLIFGVIIGQGASIAAKISLAIARKAKEKAEKLKEDIENTLKPQ